MEGHRTRLDASGTAAAAFRISGACGNQGQVLWWTPPSFPVADADLSCRNPVVDQVKRVVGVSLPRSVRPFSPVCDSSTCVALNFVSILSVALCAFVLPFLHLRLVTLSFLFYSPEGIASWGCFSPSSTIMDVAPHSLRLGRLVLVIVLFPSLAACLS